MKRATQRVSKSKRMCLFPLHQNNPCKLSLCVCAYVDIIFFFFVFFFCTSPPEIFLPAAPTPPHSALSLSLFPLCLRGDCEAQEPLRADKSKHHTGEINLELCVTRFDPAALSESLCLMRAARETKPILTPANSPPTISQPPCVCV